jgi:hypothetical protein
MRTVRAQQNRTAPDCGGAGFLDGELDSLSRQTVQEGGATWLFRQINESTSSLSRTIAAANSAPPLAAS